MAACIPLAKIRVSSCRCARDARHGQNPSAMTSPANTPPPPLKKRIVRCPGCGGDSVYAESNVYRPFCSARCKGGDLGAWANEEFRVPTEAPPEDEIYGDPRHQPH